MFIVSEEFYSDLVFDLGFEQEQFTEISLKDFDHLIGLLVKV